MTVRNTSADEWLCKFTLLGGGAIAGMAGAWLVWNFWYGIGSSVISDEEHARFRNAVTSLGALAGAVSGLALGVLSQAKSMVALIMLHGFSVMSGAITGAVAGWEVGLIGLFAGHVGVVVGCSLYSGFVTAQRHHGEPSAAPERGERVV